MSSDQAPAVVRPPAGRELVAGTAALFAAIGLAIYFAEALGLYFAVAIGGALGGVARFWCSGITARLIGETFPWVSR